MTNVDKPKKKIGKQKQLLHLRDRIMWILDEGGFNGEEVAFIFNVDRSVVSRTRTKKPVEFKVSESVYDILINIPTRSRKLKA